MQVRADNLPVRVTGISPGIVETEFSLVEQFHRDPDAANAQYKTIQALQSWDIAEAILFVLSAPEHVEINDILLRPTDQTA